MKRVFFPVLYLNGEAGRPFGPAMKFTDFLKVQSFLDAGQRNFLKTILVPASTEPQVSGFDITITGGLNFTIDPGFALDLEAFFYVSPDEENSVALILDQADPILSRIDTIVAVIARDVPARIELGRKYRELLSYADKTAVPPVVPLELLQDINTELWDTATVQIKKGTVGADPDAPDLDDDEIPLWNIRIGPGVINLVEGNLTDRRNLMRTLADPFDVVPNTGLSKVIGPFGRIQLAGAIATQEDLGVVKGSDTITIDGEGRLHAPPPAVITEDLIEGLLAGSFLGIAPIHVTRNVPLNRWDFTIDLATNLAPGAMSAQDKAAMLAATSSSTPSTFMKRSVGGDTNVRDIIVERQILLPDNSHVDSAYPNEEYIPILDIHNPIIVGTGTPDEIVNVNHEGGLPYETWMNVEDYLNVSLIFTACFIVSSSLGVVELQLYNATDGLVIRSLSQSTAVNNTVRNARSTVFNLTGTGRKRLILRYHEGSNPHLAGVTCTIWRAGIIKRPGFSNCGYSTFNNCPLI